MDYILFAGPWLEQPGTLPHRVVLHVHKLNGKHVEYVVHDQWCKKGNPGLSVTTYGYESGNYYPAAHENAFGRAMDKFWERCRNKYHEGTEGQVIGINDETVPIMPDPEAEFLATLASNPN